MHIHQTTSKMRDESFVLCHYTATYLEIGNFNMPTCNNKQTPDYDARLVPDSVIYDD